MLVLSPSWYRSLKYCPAQYKFDRVDKIKGHVFSPSLKQFQRIVITECVSHIITMVNQGLPIFADTIFQNEIEFQKSFAPHLDYKTINMNDFYITFRKTVKYLETIHFFGRNKTLAKLELGSYNKPIEILNTGVGMFGRLGFVYKTEKEVRIIDLRIQDTPIYDIEISYLYALMMKTLYGLKQLITCNVIIIGTEEIQSYPFNLDKELYIMYRLKVFKSLVDNNIFEYKPSEATCDFCNYRGQCKHAFISEVDTNQTYFKF